jgi:N utilization substance protein A
MSYISLFESITGATVKDCIIENGDNHIIFIVKQGEVGLAIGKNGSNIKRLKKYVSKPIDIVEYSDNPSQFIKNTLAPARVRSIEILEKSDGKKMAKVDVTPEDRGIAIGKNGKNIAKARILAKRHFGIDDVKIK